MTKSAYIINSRGERVLFSFDKIVNSAKRVGASPLLANEIAHALEKEIYPEIKTSVIFKKIKKLLSKKSKQFSIRFSLKEGIRRLGPTGFPFEKYVGEIFKKMGYEVKINQIIPGKCINDYEIDLLAQKGDLLYIGECKYKNISGERVESGQALINSARFLDILNGPYFKGKKYNNLRIKSLLVTNSKFTSRAENYSHCAGIELLGWRTPKSGGLEYLIESQKLYPITILPSLKGYLREMLVSEKIMLAQDILKIDILSFSKKYNIPVVQLKSLAKEARILLEIN